MRCFTSLHALAAHSLCLTPKRAELGQSEKTDALAGTVGNRVPIHAKPQTLGGA